MNDEVVGASCEIEISPGKQLILPDELIASIGPGRWRVTIEPLRPAPVRSHAAFLNGYAPEDEGLYDA